VATGIALRERVRRDPDSDLSCRARELMERGELVTDDIIVPIVMEHIGRPECLERTDFPGRQPRPTSCSLR
jgi:adenylate kinase family enzyme